MIREHVPKYKYTQTYTNAKYRRLIKRQSYDDLWDCIANAVWVAGDKRAGVACH